MMRNETNTSFGALKQINADVLNIGYAEAGKSDGPVVIKQQVKMLASRGGT